MTSTIAPRLTSEFVECFGQIKGDFPNNIGDLRFPSSLLRVILKWRALHTTSTPIVGIRAINIHVASIVAISQKTENTIRCMLYGMEKGLSDRGVLEKPAVKSSIRREWVSFKCKENSNAPLCVAVSLVISIIRQMHNDYVHFTFYIDRPVDYLVRHMANRVRRCCFRLPCEKMVLTVFRMANAGRDSGVQGALRELQLARDAATAVGAFMTDEECQYMCLAVTNVQEVVTASLLHETVREWHHLRYTVLARVSRPSCKPPPCLLTEKY